jgi:hypothetical protein
MLKIIIEKELQKKFDKGENLKLAAAINNVNKLINENVSCDLEVVIDGKCPNVYNALSHNESGKKVISFNLERSEFYSSDALESLLIHEVGHAIDNVAKKNAPILLPLVSISFASFVMGLNYMTPFKPDTLTPVEPEKALLGVLGTIIMSGVTFLTWQFLARSDEKSADDLVVKLKGPEALLKLDTERDSLNIKLAEKLPEKERSRVVAEIIKDATQPRGKIAKLLATHPTTYEDKIRMQQEFPDKFPNK